MKNEASVSGPSSVIRYTMNSFSSGTTLIEKKTSGEFTIKIGNTLAEREGILYLTKNKGDQNVAHSMVS